MVKIFNPQNDHDLLFNVTVNDHHFPAIHRVHVSATLPFELPGWNWRTHSTNIPTINRIYYIPFYLHTTRLFSTLACEVTSAGVGGTVIRLGVYKAKINANGDIEPDALELDAGVVTADSVAIKSIAFVRTLTQGWYFIAISTDGAPTLRAINDGNILTMPVSGHAATFTGTHLVIPLVSVVDGAAALSDPATAPTGEDSATRLYCKLVANLT